MLALSQFRSMSTALDAPAAAAAVAERHGQIEVDVFCTHCFYNLHGQVVTIDPQLNFPVCRCPECGRFHPAGNGVTASSVWMRRLATMLLFAWIAIVGAVTLAISFAFFGLGTASVEAFTYYESIPNGPNHGTMSSICIPGRTQADYR